MLKIRDDVDLKELEKFGYKYDDFNECWDNEIVENIEISIFKDTNYIEIIYYDYEGDYIEKDDFEEDELEYIDDLIQARNSRKSLGGNMENIDEDIKIVEELVCQKYSERLLNTLSMAKEEDEVYILTINERQAIENLLSRLKTAERMNDVLLDELDIITDKIAMEKGTGDFEFCDERCHNEDECGECKECIKEWARKKVEENEDI